MEMIFHLLQLADFSLIVNISPSKFSSIVIILTAGYLGGFFFNVFYLFAFF